VREGHGLNERQQRQDVRDGDALLLTPVARLLALFGGRFAAVDDLKVSV